MRFIPSQFNGFLFQQGSRVASDWNTAYDWTVGGVTTNTIQRSQNFPQYVSKNYAGSIKVISVTFNDVDADRDSLVIAMDVLGDEQHPLLATDRFGNLWYVDAVCIGLNETGTDKTTATFDAIFDVADPIWKKFIPSTDSITLLYGTGSTTIYPLGNQPALPIIKITPISSGGGGFAYRAFLRIINNADGALRSKPFDVTDGGWDTASLVALGHMLASGEDVRLYIGGVERKRWFGGGGMDSATTKIWTILDADRRVEVTLGADILITGDVPIITIENTAENISALTPLTQRGVRNLLCVIGDEIFAVSGVKISANGIELVKCVRAERTSAAEAHSIGDPVVFLVDDAWIYFGNPYITPYVVDDRRMPIIDMVNSTNRNPIWNNFSDLLALRTGAWRQFSNSPYTPAPGYGIYTATEQGYADPSSAMGAYVSWAPARWYITWGMYDPCGIISVEVATGKKFTYYGPPSAWWTDVVFEKSLDDVLYQIVWAESPPTAKLTWEALDTHSAVDLLGSYPYVRFKVFSPPNFSVSTSDCGHEVDGISLQLDPTKTPSVEMLTPVGIDINLSTIFTNAANGYTMKIELAMQFGQYLIVDTKEKTITMYDGTNQIPSLMDMPIRADWFPLVPGVDNDITIDDVSTVLYEITWEDRAL